MVGDQDIYATALARPNGERYIYLWRADRHLELLTVLFRQCRNPQLSLTRDEGNRLAVNSKEQVHGTQ